MSRKVSLKTLRKRAWDACSRYIRQSAADHRGYAICYTCGQSERWNLMDAGHAIPGRHNSVLYDIEILRCQCKICNVWKRGMHHVFATKLIKEKGMDWWEEKLIHAKQIVKYTRSDYETLIQEFEQKTEALKK